MPDSNPVLVKNAAALGFGGRRPIATQNLARWERRRREQDGFPWDGKFEDSESVKHYFSGDRIICLLCGRSMKSLSIHLRCVHAMSVDDYREKYGLPWSRGLCADATRTIYSAAAAALLTANPLTVAATLAKGRDILRARPPSRKRYAPYWQKERSEGIKVARDVLIVRAANRHQDLRERVRQLVEQRVPGRKAAKMLGVGHGTYRRIMQELRAVSDSSCDAT